MSLTDTAIRNAKPDSKPVRLFDERGLYLEIAPSGGKWWRLKYRFGGKEKRLSLGVYPDVSLKDARQRRDEARKLLADDVDPGENRKAKKLARSDLAANSFEVVAREWFAKYEPNWTAGHSSKILARLERDIFPWIGSRPIVELKAPELLACLRRVEDRGALETAHRALQNCGQVMRYAIAIQWLEGQDDRIYEYLATYKEPQILLDHLRSLWQQPSWANAIGCPLRILSTTKRLDYRDDQRHKLAPVLIEPIATLDDETIYRYHVYQDGFSWDHLPARIELKAIALVTYKALHKPIPIYPISQRDMDDLLEGRRIPRSLLGSYLSTDPSLEDYVLDNDESVVAKEIDELPAVREYTIRVGLNTFDLHAPVHDELVPQITVEPTASDPQPPTPSTTTGKREAQHSRWQQIEAAAIALWAQDKKLTIAQVVRQLQMIPEIKASALQADTVRKRIAKFAPEGIRGKPGRKPKESG